MRTNMWQSMGLCVSVCVCAFAANSCKCACLVLNALHIYKTIMWIFVWNRKSMFDWQLNMCGLSRSWLMSRLCGPIVYKYKDLYKQTFSPNIHTHTDVQMQKYLNTKMNVCAALHCNAGCSWWLLTATKNGLYIYTGKEFRSNHS